ncbi:MAG: hypothetical protein HY586_00190, partial [Candidatus Omnitrophica bacterium]|nr:hypothetical protein [Candidatus Omnitrophota bacterium]
NYNSFLSDKVYANGAYLFDFLRNDSVRSEVRPNVANPNVYVNPKVDNWRVSNSLNLGAVLFDFLRRQGLDFRFGMKGEYAGTNAHGELSSGGSNNPASLRFSDSQLREGWFGQVFSLTYNRWKNTTAYLGVDMEQRRLRWEDTYDARSHESVTVFGNPVPFPHYETYITFMDFVPKFKLTHRFSPRFKAGLIYKWQERHRFYDVIDDNDIGYYPGYLGNGTHRVQDVTTNFDVRLPKAWLMTYKYQFLLDTVEYERAGEIQGLLDSSRFTAAFSGPVTKKMFGTLFGMYNIYRLHTPTAPEKNNWSPFKDKYDYNGDSSIIGMNLSYLWLKNVQLYAGYQFTASYGENRNLLNEVSAGLRYSINPTATLEARYQVFDFDDRRNPKDYGDDYFGQGMYFAFRKSFA